MLNCMNLHPGVPSLAWSLLLACLLATAVACLLAFLCATKCQGSSDAARKMQQPKAATKQQQPLAERKAKHHPKDQHASYTCRSNTTARKPRSAMAAPTPGVSRQQAQYQPHSHPQPPAPSQQSNQPSVECHHQTETKASTSRPYTAEKRTATPTRPCQTRLWQPAANSCKQ
jgi:hypothetical protein